MKKYYKIGGFPQVCSICNEGESDFPSYFKYATQEIICKVNVADYRARNIDIIKDDIKRVQTYVRTNLHNVNIDLDNTELVNNLYDIFSKLDTDIEGGKIIVSNLKELKRLLVLRDNVTK